MTNDDNWWTKVKGDSLSQGDFLPECPVPVVPKSYNPYQGAISEITVEEIDVIVITQSCDLENNKAEFVALCPVYTLDEMEKTIPILARKGEWQKVRQGRIEGLHMLAGFDSIADNRKSFIVDFHQIYSLPHEFLKRFAHGLGLRNRLQAPYLEHMAQSFARFFMRVGLPSAIPSFK